jgi:hypothetical protein
MKKHHPLAKFLADCINRYTGRHQFAPPARYIDLPPAAALALLRDERVFGRIAGRTGGCANISAKCTHTVGHLRDSMTLYANFHSASIFLTGMVA